MLTRSSSGLGYRPAPQTAPSRVEASLRRLLSSVGGPDGETPYPFLVEAVVTELLRSDPAAVHAALRRLALTPSSSTRAGPQLTNREADVAHLLALGRTNSEIAEALTISEHTCRHHTERVLTKLGVRSRAAVAARLRELGEPILAAS